MGEDSHITPPSQLNNQTVDNKKSPTAPLSGQSRKNSNDYLVKLAIMNSVSLLTGGLLYKVLQNPAESPKKTSFVRLGVASIPIIAGVYYSFKLMGNLKHRALFMVRSNPNYMLPDEEAAPQSSK